MALRLAQRRLRVSACAPSVMMLNNSLLFVCGAHHICSPPCMHMLPIRSCLHAFVIHRLHNT